MRGLYRFYEELALRFAERGYAAVAIDYFGRTAGVGERDDDFAYMEHVAADDAGRHPGRRRGGRRATCASRRAQAIFTVGFCFGGTELLARRRRRPRARGRDRLLRQAGGARRPAGPDRVAAEIEAPILALQAGDDQNITPELNAAFDAALSRAAVEHELVVYDGAPHSFFDRRPRSTPRRRRRLAAGARRSSSGTSRPGPA